MVYGPKALKTASSLVLEQTAFDCETLQPTTYYLVYKYKNNGNSGSSITASEVSVTQNKTLQQALDELNEMLS